MQMTVVVTTGKGTTVKAYADPARADSDMATRNRRAEELEIKTRYTVVTREVADGESVS